MPPQKRAKKHSCRGHTVQCAGAGCGGELLVADGAEEVVTFCDGCFDKVHADRGAGEEDPYWFVSHVDHRYIAWSSNEDLVSVTPLPLGESSQRPLAPGDAMRRAAELLASADAVFVTAGAGCSIDSGLPDFRGRGGWYRFGGTDLRMDQVDFKPASPHLLKAWELIGAMVAAFRARQPHAGYARLAAALFPPPPALGAAAAPPTTTRPTAPPATGRPAAKRAFVLTSNIDNYFEASGVPPASLFEAHGTVEYLQCTSVGTGAPCAHAAAVWPLDAAAAARLAAAAEASKSGGPASSHCAAHTDPLPRCGCGALARPNVSHSTDADADLCPARKAGQRAAMCAWLARERRVQSRLVVLELGCGTSPHALRRDSELVAAKQRAGGGTAALIRVDPGDAAVPEGDEHVGVALGALEALLGMLPEDPWV